MMVTPPTYIKRDGIQYRVDGVHENKVFLWSQFDKSFVLDVSLGTLIQQAYHPSNLVQYTLQSWKVCYGIFGEEWSTADHGMSWREGDVRALRMAKEYVLRLSRLVTLHIPCSVVSITLLPIIEAVIVRVPAKEFHQGIKSLYGVDIPKVQVNYLSKGYQMECSLEELVCKVRDEGQLCIQTTETDLH